MEDVLKVYESKGIAHNVTYRRMEKVMNGYVDNNGNKVKGLGGNLAYLQTDFVPKTQVKSVDKLKLNKKVYNLIKMRENVTKEIYKGKFNIYESKSNIIVFYPSTQVRYLDRVKEKIKDCDKKIKIYASEQALNKGLKEKLDYEIEVLPESLVYLYN